MAGVALDGRKTNDLAGVVDSYGLTHSLISYTVECTQAGHHADYLQKCKIIGAGVRTGSLAYPITSPLPLMPVALV